MSDDKSPITADRLLTVLSRHIGKANGISAQELVARCDAYWLERADKVNERQVRKLIEELRRDGHHVCATPQHGYFLAADAAELDETCNFLYERAMTSLMQVSAMKRVSLPDLRGQLRLRT